MLHRHRVFALVLIALAGAAVAVQAQGRIPTPKEHYGFNIGDDYVLANYTDTEAYWKTLDQASDRMTLVDIGRTAEGRTQWMAIITSPENHKRLEHYRTISAQLHEAVGLTDEEARKLASEGRAVVWIDGGLHATEVVGAQSLVEFVYQMVTRTDAETMRFLDDVIVLCVPANPDGMELVSNWYMRNPDPARRSSAGLPRLYQKYAGHDNNRDSYMVNMPETENMNRVMFRQWYPQIMYNHHQSGPAGTVEFMPPFRDPFNYYYDPLIPLGIEQVGTAMHSRMAAEGKPGTTMRSGASYSTWWNGGLRTTAYFQNIIGLLTEIIGNPTPQEIPFVPQRMLPSNDYPFPIMPQRWHIRQSIDYEITANRAVLDVASRYRDTFLFNLYTMGRNQIARGSTDTWTVTPKRVEALQAQIARENPPLAAGGRGGGRGGGGRGGAAAKYFELLRKPEDRDPRGFVLPSDQPDFLTATKFVNALLKNGVRVHRATAPFEIAGKTYPAGSYVLKTAQAARAMVLDLLEPQDHPNDFAYPGGPPRPPYDSAGWTLAYQMGVKFDRILDGFDGPFEVVPDVVKPPKGSVAAPRRRAVGYLVSGQVNDAFVAINRLLAAGEDVYRLTEAMTEGAASFVPGSVYVAAKATTMPQLQTLADEVGLTFVGTSARVPAGAVKLKKVRIGLWDRYGGSMPSGWTRWLFEQYGFPFEVVYPQALDAGHLIAKYDVLVFVDGAIPARETGGGPDAFMGGQPQASNIPEEYRAQLGSVSISKTVPELKKFVEDGGR
ncbi:MAG: M14 metallopeptidase family protein, partial [Acidobacteriota bacterium]